MAIGRAPSSDEDILKVWVEQHSQELTEALLRYLDVGGLASSLAASATGLSAAQPAVVVRRRELIAKRADTRTIECLTVVHYWAVLARGTYDYKAALGGCHTMHASKGDSRA